VGVVACEVVILVVVVVVVVILDVVCSGVYGICFYKSLLYIICQS